MKFFGLTLAVLLLSGFVAIEARSVEKRNIFTDLMANAQSAFNGAKEQIEKFIGSAINDQIQQARESFLTGLEQLQNSADEIIEDGVDALHKYLPGLQGILTDRVDSVTSALDKYVSENDSKLDEVRRLLLENAQKALKTLKDRLHAAQSTEVVNQIVNSVDKIENSIVNEVSAAKSRSLFGINWSGLKDTVKERFESLRNQFDDMLDSFRGDEKEDKIREHRDRIQGAMDKINRADRLPPPKKIEAVKEATAELDQADEVVASVASQSEDSTSASA